MSGLTAVQLRLLTYVINYIDEELVAPSFDEMRNSIGLASKSGVHRLLGQLESQGWITRSYHGVRDITILRRPASRDPYSLDRLASLDPTKFEQLALNIVTLQARRAT